MAKPAVRPPVVALEGDLRVISLFDLGQLLRLNGATGCLAIQDGTRKGSLYFDGGELINAVDDAFNQGEEAAIGLFGSSCAAGFTMSLEPITMATSVVGKSSLISSISITMS